MTTKEKKGSLFVVSAPSGAGKTTLLKRLFACVPGLEYSISATTRAPRKGEQDGKDYFFISRQEFLQGIEQNRWAEWATVHGNYYGTSQAYLRDAIQRGASIVLDIDVQGARQIVKLFPDAVTIFVLPPSLKALEMRLANRGTDDSQTIAKRLEAAKWEMEQKGEFAHQIVNDDLNSAVRGLCSIVLNHKKGGALGQTAS
jgi:guanylate kinase